MGLGHGDQVTGDFPGRKQPQAFLPLFIHPARGEIGASLRTGLRDPRKTRSRERRVQFRQRRIGVDVEIGGRPHAVLRHARASCAVFSSIYAKTHDMEEKAASQARFLSNFREKDGVIRLGQKNLPC